MKKVENQQQAEVATNSVAEMEMTLEMAKAILKKAQEARKEKTAEAKKLKDEQKAAEKNAPLFLYEQSQKLPIVCSVSVNKSVGSGMTIAQAASGHWKIAEIKTLTLKHVVAEQNGLIVGAFDIAKCTFVPESPDGENRYWFDLVPSETMAQFIGHRIPKKKGMASPCLFNFTEKAYEVKTIEGETIEETTEEVAAEA